MKKTLLFTFLLALFTTLGFSQTAKYWSATTESRNSIPVYKAVKRLSFPKEFKLFTLNIEPLRQELFTVVNNASRHSTIISLPNTDGNMEQFEVFEASNFEPALQAEYPQIRAFSGKGITDRYATLKLSISPAGIQTMVFRTNKAEFIERYSEDHTVYAVFTSQRNPGQLPWACTTDDHAFDNDVHAKITNSNFTNSSAGQLKVMRLAQSCNGEYANYFGATSVSQIALVYAGINATITRCNGCYEKDLGVHLNVIAGNDPVIFFNAATDPYTTWNNTTSPANGINDWNGQLLTTLKALIGDANFDIGHMFGKSGGGGNAGCIGCVCGNGTTPGTYKGAGITSPADNIPEGDNFDIDYVVHEVGHQMGGNHTFSFGYEGGTSAQKEVGSGITIMGYAGITNQNDSSHSIPYYHEATIRQIQTNLATKTCPVTTDITAVNATPVVAAVGNYTIPISTPFALTGSATDANPGDALTYQWEQNDDMGSTQTAGASAASATKATGPNWLSFNPTASGTRYLPRLTSILNGALFTNALAGGTPNLKVEYLSSVNRTLNFRCTVRDNSPYVSTAPVSVGQTAFTDMVVTVTNTSGPFAVTVPNTNVSWQAGSTQTITWAVANTTLAPVSCANVKISLSIDGGYTWPIVLVANTPNDGTETVTIPNNVTTTARVVIESVGNIFFDISNTNFTITPPATGFSFNSVAPITVACGGAASSTATLATTASGGFVTPIDLTATGNPAGTTVTFSTTPIAPGSSADVTLTGTNTLAPGTYNVVVTGTAGAISQNSTISFTVQPGTPPSITTQPAAASVCSGTAATFTVASPTAGVTYQWQVNSGTGFSDIAGATSATYTFTTTQGDDGNLYHVIITYLCGTTTSTDVSLTVNTAANITTQPADFTACENDSHTFTVVASGTGLNYQWQVSTDGGTTFTNIAGETNATLTLATVTPAMDGNQYHVIISSATSPCTAAGSSNAVTLTVNPLPVLTATANPVAVCTGNPSTLNATGAASYSWTASFGTITSGANSATPIVTPEVNPGTPSVPNPIVYTVTGTSLGCSSTATVTVTANPLPVVTITADAATTILPYQTVTLTAAVTPAGSFTYTWDRDGVVVPNNNTNTITVGITELGDYGVFVSDATGTCGSNSNRITVVDSINGKFYIYPNPNTGQFVIQVRVPNLIGNVTCFDSKGARVYAQINVTDRAQYQVIDVNLGGASSGVYVLAIYDKAGVRLATERVVVRH
ncbi:MAG: reprolysin-like metallopeptidase [Ferruginibacter sp.]